MKYLLMFAGIFAGFMLGRLVALIILNYNSTPNTKYPYIYLNSPSQSKATDYQINIYYDTLWLYDGNRLVGKIDYTKEKLDSLIYKDNE